jgi:Holliday junction resolvase
MNSRQKGKRIELAAAHFLTELGYPAARGVQHSGSPDSPDIRCASLWMVHIEVKGDRSIGLNTQALTDAMDQAIRDSGHKMPVVLWWEHRKGWRLTWLHRWEGRFVRTTTDRQDDIAAVLSSLQVLGECEPTRKQFHPASK